jgi:hypothetical protein
MLSKDISELFERFLEGSGYLNEFLILLGNLDVAKDVALVENVQWAAGKTHEAIKNAE